MILDKLVSYWTDEDWLDAFRLNTRTDNIIVPLTYTILPTGLTDATREILFEAIRMGKIFPVAKMAMVNCGYTFTGAAAKEKKFKLEVLRLVGLKNEVIWAEDANNSEEEAKRIKEALEKLGIQPRRILIVTGMIHSRRAKFIWRKEFPEAEIFCRCVSWRWETQCNHPNPIQRVQWIWYLANVAVYVAIRMGLNISKYHHHSSLAKH